MKYSSYDDYKWFLLGCAITAGEIFWKGEGSTNKGLTTEVSEDGTVINISSET